MTGDPTKFFSIREALEESKNFGKVLKVRNGGDDFILIDTNNENVQNFIESVQKDFQKANKKYPDANDKRFDKKMRNWEIKAQDIIAKNIEKHFGKIGSDTRETGLIIVEKSLDQARRSENNIDKNKIDTQVLDCNPVAALTAYALAESCPDKERDFRLFTVNKFTINDHNKFTQNKEFETVQVNHKKLPIHVTHTVVAMEGTNTVMDVMQGHPLFQVSNTNSELNNDYNLFETKEPDDNTKQPVILTFDKKLYKEADDGNFYKNEIYSTRIMQIKAAQILMQSFPYKDEKMYSKEELALKDILENYANNNESYINPKNTALVIMAYEASDLGQDVITFKEMDYILNLEKHNETSTLYSTGIDDDDLKNVFKGMNILVQDNLDIPGERIKDNINFKINDEVYSIKAEVETNPNSRYR